MTKWAFNAAFERICLSRYLRENRPDHFISYGEEEKYLDPLGWKCSHVLAASLGFPLSLKNLGEALGLPERKGDIFQKKENCCIAFLKFAITNISLNIALKSDIIKYNWFYV